VDFLDGELNNALVHPFGYLQLFYEHILDVRDDLIAKFLGLGRESLLNEEAT
jgi:hypothetical protein